MWQLSSMRLRIYSLFQKYRARSATWDSKGAEWAPGSGVPAGARPGARLYPPNPGCPTLHTPNPQGSSDPLEKTV